MGPKQPRGEHCDGQYERQSETWWPSVWWLFALNDGKVETEMKTLCDAMDCSSSSQLNQLTGHDSFLAEKGL
ncbi:hypothetical protein NQZ68_010524 [Dissostichus eleginoides]|nr:hypothetical protein NQZ68_010524 [Dissostichus eleginoides]